MQIQVDDRHSVSALLQVSPEPVASLVMAHAAGAGMHQAFMEAVAAGLFQRRIAHRGAGHWRDIAEGEGDRPLLPCAGAMVSVDPLRQGASRDQSSRVDCNRSAFPTTLTDDSAIAAAAMMGDSKIPNIG